ncbi:glycoside hydrolase family 2 protein [Marinoscillum furvescens]|uniref:Glycosyl hydrolase family 2 n=1 Tax=Marinoscillum furvescens DSM 4134 TaxID=1122208 RepID=A0A3D9L051_MARFU|nr:sugar-binding domain-containing protein [Marinoscillum furvescens]RED95273.1 glycosyl hydrolase family 2 [Marinoscillum furvescens DSM 4134]
MKNILLLYLMLGVLSLQAQWQPAGDKIKTKWAAEVDPDNVWPEYPRPIMERADWQNLNGLWSYAIAPVNTIEPGSYDGNILVPFAVESSLSGVQRAVGKENVLWYKRTFEVPDQWEGQNVLLHFGAVDWRAEVIVNGIKVGEHEGGYAPFYFDITPYLVAGEQELKVKVWDPTDEGPQPRGKQVKDPEGIWYTPVTGIWQTVWLEPVSEKSITSIKTTPDIDASSITLAVKARGTTYGDIITVKVTDGATLIAEQKAAIGQELVITIPDQKLWSPESPFLYGLQVSITSQGKVTDQVNSYFAMRKISSKRDQKGIVRLQLNNEDYFQFGPLDQGWWPDGLYTAPSDEALMYDIKKTKEFGFNMIRKHVKVEPARWYTHCDRMGVLVWQDMPNGDQQPIWQNRQYFTGTELKRTSESEAIFLKEWKEIMDHLFSYPSIVCWVPFNEGWGQFKTKEIVEWNMAYDPSRLINPASGGNHFPVGDMLDLHNYPGPEMYLYDAQRATVLGEYGGIGLALKGHLWETDRNWGYIQFKSSREVTAKYVTSMLKSLRRWQNRVFLLRCIPRPLM